jgi:hypothetical protein
MIVENKGRNFGLRFTNLIESVLLLETALIYMQIQRTEILIKT